MSQSRSLQQALNSRQPDEPAAAWLTRILDALPADGDADDELLEQVKQRVNGTDSRYRTSLWSDTLGAI